MSKKGFIEIIRQKTKEDFGNKFDEVIFQKALAKAKRWMRGAYGEVDYECFILGPLDWTFQKE